MPPMLDAFMKKLNANEKMVVYGAAITVVAFILGLVTGGAGFSFIAGIVVIVIYWLKYAPNQTMTWPAPVQTIVLIVAALAALGALLALLALIGPFGFLYGAGGALISVINAVGAAMMAWFAYKEYQAMPKMAPPAPPAPPAAPPAA